MDEMGNPLGLTRLSGRAAPGKRLPDQVPGDRGGRVSPIGALALDGIRPGLRAPGAMNGETRRFCGAELLVPPLQRGEVVVRENSPLHTRDDIEDAIEAAGAWGLFLPTYSPDLNPIEHGWAKGKARLRSLKPRTEQELLEALVNAFSSITRYDSLGWFRHCGYRVALT